MSELVVTTPAPHVAHLRLNRPEARNALNLALRERLAEAMVQANADPAIRAIVVGGDEKAFAAGADLRELQELDAVGALARRAPELMRPVAESRKPVIAAVRGFAFGGGFELALACDIIVAGEGAKFALPEVKVGVMPGGGGTQRLSRVVGKQRAMLLALTGRAISGREAGDMGIASAVVPDADVEQAALSIAGEIAALPPIGVQMIKEAILRGADQPLDAALAFERRSFQFLFATDDRTEGIAAFFGKRAPEFRGR